VNVIVDEDFQVGWNEIVLSGWVGFNNVSTLTTDVQVVDSSEDGRISLTDFEGERSVLESTSELSGINSQRHVDNTVALIRSNINVRVVLEEFRTVLVRESCPWVIVSRRDIVSNSQNSSGGRVVRDLPVVVVGDWHARFINTISVTKVVVTVLRSGQAVWSRDSPSWLFEPFSLVGQAFLFLVVLRQRAVVLALNVLGFSFVVLAVGSVISEDDNVFPWGWMPVWVVVAFFRAFESRSASSRVLSGAASTVSWGLISNVETLVTITSRAVLVVVVRFVHTILEHLSTF
jgi:hypothetical protein